LQTIANIGNQGFQRIPLLSFLSQKNHQDVKAGGAKAGLAIARYTESVLMAAVIAKLYMSGNLTSTGPKDPTLAQVTKDAGRPPYSVIVNDPPRMGLMAANRRCPWTSSTGTGKRPRATCCNPTRVTKRPAPTVDYARPGPTTARAHSPCYGPSPAIGMDRATGNGNGNGKGNGRGTGVVRIAR
jgi:hypothetical protein